MICLERLDGRAFSLPFELIPTIEMSRRLARSFVSVAIILGPYLVNILPKLSGEFLCSRN